jgi:GNAT superfamily N-acetyltransferase
MTDPQIAAVEDNLLRFFATASDVPVLRRDPVDDVEAVHSDVPFPMFNAVTAARFGADVTRRTGEVLDSYIAAGLPWMWWLTPSTTSAELESVLEERGLAREDVPGMYVDLATAPVAAQVAGLTIERTHDVAGYVDVMVAGFGLPEPVRAPMSELMGHYTEAINVVASLDGRSVACGTAYLTGPTAGLYNIATVEDARGRGIGYAVTATLMELARAAGADHAILHATESGRPVYERAGFVEVCQVPQYVWMPTDLTAEIDPA